jgi:hypothetical protein
MSEETKKTYEGPALPPNSQVKCEDCGGMGKNLEGKFKGMECPSCNGMGTVEQAWPRTIYGIQPDENAAHHREKLIFGGKCGDWVSVRPAAGDKTYLGVLLGEFPTGVALGINRKNSHLRVSLGPFNPAIYVPDLKRVVFGYESWWGKLKGPDDLRQITDADINDVWYVRALEELTATAAP